MALSGKWEYIYYWSITARKLDLYTHKKTHRYSPCSSKWKTHHVQHLVLLTHPKIAMRRWRLQFFQFRFEIEAETTRMKLKKKKKLRNDKSLQTQFHCIYKKSSYDDVFFHFYSSFLFRFNYFKSLHSMQWNIKSDGSVYFLKVFSFSLLNGNVDEFFSLKVIKVNNKTWFVSLHMKSKEKRTKNEFFMETFQIHFFCSVCRCVVVSSCHFLFV